MTSERALTLEAISYAADCASEGRDLPLGLGLRTRGHIACRTGEVRIGLAELGTAVELWLTALLGAEHRLTLGGLVAELRRSAVSLPEDIQEGFVDLRNDAVHRGDAPRGDQLQ